MPYAFCLLPDERLKGANNLSDCIFCKIANKEIDSNLVYEDETVAAFRDLNPQAPQHILIVPKKHVANITELDDKDLAAHIFTEVVPKRGRADCQPFARSFTRRAQYAMASGLSYLTAKYF